MLTRLKIDGFKNLVDVDISFGPFTCIAGANAVGKSNLFDAIVFLSDLTDKTFSEAAANVRGDGQINDMTAIRNLFYSADGMSVSNIRLEAEMIIPVSGMDNLRQPLVATITFLTYILELRLRDDAMDPAGPIALVEESLTHITQSNASKHLPFAGGKEDWRKSVVKGKRSGGPFISTSSDNGEHVIKLHQDGGSRGRAVRINGNETPRTLLSATNFENPTALLALQEMRSWQRLQLESTAMRQSDSRMAPGQMASNGANLPKTLFSLAGDTRDVREVRETDTDPTIYERLSNRLADLLDDVHEVKIDVDQHRDLLTLMVAAENKKFFPAKSLSDGTLRFLALGILELSENNQVLCLEEPENGIHPTRIGAMLNLLHDIAMDIGLPLAGDNPLRQVIINTHSPGIVEKLDPNELVVIDLHDMTDANGSLIPGIARFSPMVNTWRERFQSDRRCVSLSSLVEYLTFADRSSDASESRATVKDVIESQLELSLD